MDASAVADRYFEAWNRRDPAAIAAVFTEGGTYTDPNVPDGVGPEDTAAYAEGLFGGFPDLAFELESSGVRPDGSVAAQSVMTGTNSGSFQGLPPSGREVRLPGADVITVDGDRVASVVGYFDTAVVPRQLGLQVVVQPERAGPFAFGTSVYVSKDGGEPGAMSLTVLEARSPEEIEEVRTRTRQVVSDLVDAPGVHELAGRRRGQPHVHDHGVGERRRRRPPLREPHPRRGDAGLLRPRSRRAGRRRADGGLGAPPPQRPLGALRGLRADGPCRAPRRLRLRRRAVAAALLVAGAPAAADPYRILRRRPRSPEVGLSGWVASATDPGGCT
jgi:steroid delta-isomerase-like uncharacterized protein